MTVQDRARSRTLIAAGLLTSVLVGARAVGDALHGNLEPWLLTGRALFIATGLLAAALFTFLPERHTRTASIALIPFWVIALFATIKGTGGVQSPYLWALYTSPLIAVLLVPDDLKLALCWGLTAPLAGALISWSEPGGNRASLGMASMSLTISALAVLGTVRYRKVRKELNDHLLAGSRRVAERLNAAAGQLVWKRTEMEVLTLAEQTLAELEVQPTWVSGESSRDPSPNERGFAVTADGSQVGTMFLRRSERLDLHIHHFELFLHHVSAALENVNHLKRAREQLEEVQRLQQELINQERLAALGEAASMMAHEVRNPLTSMLNGVTLLRRQLPAEQTVEVLDMLSEDGHRLERLVQDLLFLARPITPASEELSLYELAETSAESVVKRSPGPRRLSIEGDPSVQVFADPHQLLLAVENLVRNAAQSTQADGRIVVTVTGDGQTARLRVEDDGPGLPPEHAHKIFEPFFSLRSSGTGLGLAIVQRVVKAHGGDVRADRSPLGGALLEFSIPQSGSAHASGTVTLGH
jgi:signal transduction histidine kinase